MFVHDKRHVQMYLSAYVVRIGKHFKVCTVDIFQVDTNSFNFGHYLYVHKWIRLNWIFVALVIMK